MAGLRAGQASLSEYVCDPGWPEPQGKGSEHPMLTVAPHRTPPGLSSTLGCTRQGRRGHVGATLNNGCSVPFPCLQTPFPGMQTHPNV